MRIATRDLDRCLDLALRVEREPPRRWPWQKKPDREADVFAREWASAVREEVVFEGSGHLLWIVQADAFLKQGMSRIGDDDAVVFIIS